MTRTMRLAPLVAAFLVLVPACVGAKDPPGSTTGSEAALPEAAALIARVKEKYRSINARPQQIIQTFETTTRVLGRPDVETEGTMNVLQQGEDVRGDINVVAVRELGQDGVRELALPGRTSFLRNAGELRIHHDAGPNQPVLSYSVKKAELGKGIDVTMMGPMATLQFFDAMLTVPVTVRSEFYQGRPSYTLRSSRAFAVGPTTLAEAKLWVNAETLLVDYMEVSFENQVSLPKEQTAWVSMSASFEYKLDVQVTRSAFQLPLDPQAENFSDETQDLAAKQAARTSTR